MYVDTAMVIVSNIKFSQWVQAVFESIYHVLIWP